MAEIIRYEPVLSCVGKGQEINALATLIFQGFCPPHVLDTHCSFVLERANVISLPAQLLI